jgi:hypothetical protein
MTFLLLFKKFSNLVVGFALRDTFDPGHVLSSCLARADASAFLQPKKLGLTRNLDSDYVARLFAASQIAATSFGAMNHE